MTSQPIRLSTNFMTLIPSMTLTELWVVSMEHLQRLWHASRGRLPFQTPGSVPLFGTCLCSNCWDKIPRTCHSLFDFSHWIPLGTFSILLSTVHWEFVYVYVPNCVREQINGNGSLQSLSCSPLSSSQYAAQFSQLGSSWPWLHILWSTIYII